MSGATAKFDALRREAVADKARVSRFFTFTIDAAPLEMKEREDGSWELDGVATRGDAVFDYSSEAGEEWREYRPMAEVFAATSINSLTGATLTDDHPIDFVDIYNHRDLNRGVVMLAWQDGTLMRVRVIARDAELLDKIRAGKVALSCGYTAIVVPGDGEHPTEGRYQATQTQIIHNHLAVVDAARAGPVAKLAAPPPAVTVTPAGDKRPDNKRAGKQDEMGEITINGVVFKVDPTATTVPTAVVEAITASTALIEQLKARVIELEQKQQQPQQAPVVNPAPATTPAPGLPAPDPTAEEPEDGAMADKDKDKAGDAAGKGDKGLTRVQVEAMLDERRQADAMRTRVLTDSARVLPATYEYSVTVDGKTVDKPNARIVADALIELDKTYKDKADAMAKADQVDALLAVLDVKLADANRSNIVDFGEMMKRAKDGQPVVSADASRKAMIDRKRGIAPAAAGGDRK